jgi:hypothetical protein
LLTLLLAVVLPSLASGGPYEFRAEKNFANEIDGHRCKHLFVQRRDAGWVYRPTETAVGLVAKVCKEEPEPYKDAADSGTTYGGVLDGWHVVDQDTGKTTPLTLPQADDFSNPSFCGPWAAYWGIAEGVHNALIVTDLRNKKILKRVPIADVRLATDYMYHLAPATWNKDCTSARFKDERYIKTTVIDAKSN